MSLAANMLIIPIFLLMISADGQHGMTLPQANSSTSRAEREPDREVEAALRSQLPTKLSRDESDTIFYSYNRVDLNGDGHAEVIGYVVGGPVCSIGGCSAFILERAQNGYRLLATLPLVTVPIYVANTSSHGWRDLVVSTADEGMQLSYYKFRFSGQTYAKSSGVFHGGPVNRPVDGIPYLVGGTEKILRLSNRK